MKTDLFQSCGHCWVFQVCWHIECSTFTASSFRIWNSSAGIPSPPLALFVVMLPKAHLTSHSRMLGWCWERLKAWGDGDNRGWDGWTASLTQWTWVWETLGVDDGQGGLACYSPWGCKESDMTERLNRTEYKFTEFINAFSPSIEKTMEPFFFSLLILIDFKIFLYFNRRLITLQYCGGFAIHWHEPAMGVLVSPILKLLPPPSPSHPSGLSQCTSFEFLVSCIELALVICFTYGNIHVSMLFSQIIPPSPSPTESKSLFFISGSLLLSRI